ncbi:MAG: M20 family metallopeptidase [Anaerovoracaceae bacterium]|jgi:aminobenzoyl-glutamate utilization protein B
MDKKKESVIQEIQSHRDDLLRMADFICDNPEIGLREHQASALLTEHLRKNGFSVELGIAGLDTAFRCVYENGSGGRSIGLLCEYDALEGIGHGCGHHIQGPSILGAAVALKKCIPEDIPYKLVVYGTPAEETVGGKITMVEQGYFRDIDVAFMMHASGSGTSVDRRMMAMTGMEVAYTGKSAHAAICPEEGRSALDALILAFHGIECLREHVPDDVRMHYAITDGGLPANVIHARASASIIARAFTTEVLQSVTERIRKILDGAALMTETSYSIVETKTLNNSIPVPMLNELLMNNAEKVNAPRISPPREKTGSSDFGNVCYIVPGACIRISTEGDTLAASHSREAALQGKSKENHDAVIYAAQIIALTVLDLLADEEVFAGIIESFRENKAQFS